jgi:hypothetical protein
MTESRGRTASDLARWLACAAVALVIATACAPAAPAATASDIAAQNAAIQRAFEQHSDGAELTATGMVDRVLSDQSGPSGPHERFIVRLSSGMTVLIEHNLSIAPRVPVAVGMPVTVHGEYVWNAEGGLLHFTHHDPDRSHEAGYILYSGRRYD